MKPVLAALGLTALAVVFGVAGAEPELAVITPDGPARLNHVYRVVCEVTWTGEPSAYVVLPAEADPIDWGTVTVREATATVRGDMNVVSQVIEFVPNETGEFTTPEIRIAYLHPEATSSKENSAQETPLPDSSDPPSLRVEPITLLVRPGVPLAWISCGLGVAFLVCIGLLIVLRVVRRRQSRIPAHAGAVDTAAIQSALHSARRHRLDANYYDFYRELTRAAEIMAVDDQEPDFLASLKARTQEVGYRGGRPTDDQMDTDYRSVERALARYEEDRQE